MITPLESPDLSLDYQASDPFPHVVIDGFFGDSLKTVAAEASGWENSPNKGFYAQVGKRTISRREEMGEHTLALIDRLNSDEFINWLEKLTGISGLVADHNLLGGGVHRVGRGGYLKIHADFNWHRELQLHRRINVIVYLNEGWQEDWGGNLELWPADMSRCAKSIAPRFDRMVIFNTDDTSFHGHPDPLTCPEGVTRNSVALYYYSAEPASTGKHRELTDYRERPREHFGSLKHRIHQFMIRHGIGPRH